MLRVVACIAAVIFAAVPGFAAVVDVEAENVQKQGSRVEAIGNVLVSGDNMKLRANYVIYDSDTDDVWAVGNCRLEEKSGETSAEALYYNARRKDFHLENGSVFLYAEPAIISGESITRYGEDQYEGDNIEFTPCLGNPPSWSLAAGSFEAPLEKYGNATNVRFQVRELPILYFPYLYFPIKLKRQSGFLMPSFSNSSDYGYRVGIPYYLVLSRSTDATFTPTFLSRRGLLMAGEFRYRLDEKQQGEIYFESLLNDKMSGEKFDGSILDAVPDSRWLFRSFQNGGSLNWDIKLVSNPDYFRDIGPMYSNETVWRDILNTGQGRSLEELVSRGQWSGSAKSYTANVSGLWKQSLIVPSNAQTLQELPRIDLRMNQTAIPQTPAFISSQLSTVNVYSLDWIREVKDTGQVQLNVPLTYFPYFTLMPSYTQFYRDAHIIHNPDTFQSDAIRTLYESGDSSITSNYSNPAFFGSNPGIIGKSSYQELWENRSLSLTTTLYSQRFLEGLYHQVVPNVSWSYLSRIGGNYDSSDVDDFFPALLSEDVWSKTAQMKVGVDNYIRDRSGKSLVEFSLSRIYDYLLKEWSYYEGNVVVQPAPWITLRHLNRFGAKEHPYATIEHWTQLSLSDLRGDELYVSEEFNKIDTKKAIMGVKTNLTHGLTGRYEVNYDFLKDRYVDTRQVLNYTSQCWNLEVYREVDTSEEALPRNTTIGVTVNLLGLGQVLHTKRSVEGTSAGGSSGE